MHWIWLTLPWNEFQQASHKNHNWNCMNHYMDHQRFLICSMLTLFCLNSRHIGQNHDFKRFESCDNHRIPSDNDHCSRICDGGYKSRVSRAETIIVFHLINPDWVVLDLLMISSDLQSLVKNKEEIDQNLSGFVLIIIQWVVMFPLFSHTHQQMLPLICRWSFLGFAIDCLIFPYSHKHNW
jgi:hypothetical protein